MREMTTNSGTQMLPFADWADERNSGQPVRRRYSKRKLRMRRRKLTQSMMTVHNRSGLKSITFNKWISDKAYSRGFNNMYVSERCCVFTLDDSRPRVSYMTAATDAHTAVCFSKDIVDAVSEWFGLGVGSHYLRVSEVETAEPEIRLIVKLEEVIESQAMEEPKAATAGEVGATAGEAGATAEPSPTEKEDEAGEEEAGGTGGGSEEGGDAGGGENEEAGGGELQADDAAEGAADEAAAMPQPAGHWEQDLQGEAKSYADNVALAAVGDGWMSEDARRLAASLWSYSKQDISNAFLAGAIWMREKMGEKK